MRRFFGMKSQNSRPMVATFTNQDNPLPKADVLEVYRKLRQPIGREVQPRCEFPQLAEPFDALLEEVRMQVSATKESEERIDKILKPCPSLDQHKLDYFNKN